MTVVRALGLDLGFRFIEGRAKRRHDHAELFRTYEQFRCTTSVTRVPEPLALTLASSVATLPGADSHYIYPHGDIHLTIANLDSSALVPAEAAEECARVVASARPFSIGIRGFGVTPQSVFAKAWDTDGSMARLRAAIARATGARLSAPRRLLGFVNLMRFQSPDIENLSAGVGQFRRTDFGAFEVQQVQIVQTDKVLSAAGTQILATATLTDRSP